VRIVDPTWAGVRDAMERIFDEVGLPNAIRSDNGSPSGSTGAGGLSALSVWWLKLGIEPRYIPPSSPQDNGRHERMHRTLKAETSSPAAATPAEQQRRFDRFRRHYNEKRPHETLEQTPPAAHWWPPARTFPARLEDPWYDANHEVRRVRWNGMIKWHGEEVFIGGALASELIGLAEHESGGHIARFCHRDLGVIDRDGRFLRFAPPRARLRRRCGNGGDTARLTGYCQASARSKVSGISPVEGGYHAGQNGRSVTVVDINPQSITLARRYFSLPAHVACYVDDGASFLRRSEKAFDSIGIDASTEERVPHQLCSVEFFSADP
jgi:Integrase core domain